MALKLCMVSLSTRKWAPAVVVLDRFFRSRSSEDDFTGNRRLTIHQKLTGCA